MKKRQQHITAFYMEMLVLIAVFMVVILILTQVFALSRGQSTQARVLTNAVTLAENTAELVAASDSWETFVGLLQANERTDGDKTQGTMVLNCGYDSEMKPDPNGSYQVEVEWIPADGASGELMESRIRVYWNDGEEPVYTLETAVYLGTSARQ